MRNDIARDEPTADVVAETLSWIGTPYRHQASRKAVACDCLGLVRGVWRTLYGTEPEPAGPYSMDWAETGSGDRLLEAARRHFIECHGGALQPGRLILFRWRAHLPAKHAGVLVGPDAFAHAYEGRSVVVSALVSQWRKRIAGVFAFPPMKKDVA